MKYEVSGIVTKGEDRKFKIEVVAPTEVRAKDSVCKLLGGNQGAKRSQIKIGTVREVA